MERVILIIVAMLPMAMATMGITKFLQESTPIEGNQPSFREKSIISMSESQKGGTEHIIIATAVTTLSVSVYCFTAETMPIGTPMIVANPTPKNARINVYGSRAISSETTESPVRYEVPKSPRTALKMYLK